MYLHVISCIGPAIVVQTHRAEKSISTNAGIVNKHLQVIFYMRHSREQISWDEKQRHHMAAHFLEMFHPLSNEGRRVLWKWGNLPQGICSERGTRYSQSIFTIHHLFFFFYSSFAFSSSLDFPPHPCPSALLMIYTASSVSLLSGYICTPSCTSWKTMQWWWLTKAP